MTAHNPYAPPVNEPGPSGPTRGHARSLGSILIVENGSVFPPVCLKCGATGALESRRQLFTYAPPWARLLGMIVLLFVRKKSRFDLPVCAPCNGVWRRWNGILLLALLAPFGMIAVSSTMLAMSTSASAGTTFMLTIPLGFLGTLAVARLRAKHVVTATRVDNEETWLSGVHEAAVRAAISRSP